MGSHNNMREGGAARRKKKKGEIYINIEIGGRGRWRCWCPLCNPRRSINQTSQRGFSKKGCELPALPLCPLPLYSVCRDSVCDKREKDGLSDLHLGENGVSSASRPLPLRTSSQESKSPVQPDNPPSFFPSFLPFMFFRSSIYCGGRQVGSGGRRVGGYS